jgi:DNA replication protein DnaC
MPRHCSLYVTCMGLIRAVRATWSRDSQRTEVDVLDEFGTVELLVIDEVGVQSGTDNEQSLIFDVLDRRYRDMRPSILLTNQDKAGFRGFVGDRVFDRLTETGRWVSFDWGSYRTKARTEIGKASPSNDPNFNRDERA